MRILVTGGAGYVGSFCVRALLEAEHGVVVLDDLRQGHRQALPSGLLVEGDVRDGARVRRLLRERSIEAVMHFAGSTSVPESVENPGLYYDNNLAASLSLLEAMVDAGVSLIVFSSTCAVYQAAEGPLGEDNPLGPTSPYAATKLAVERMIADFGRANAIGHVLLRYFNAAGASADGSHGEDHDPETHLVPICLEAALGLRPGVTIFGTDYPTPDGTCVRDYLHVEDLIDAHLLVLEALQPGEARAYNVGIGKGYSVREVIETALRVTGVDFPVTEGARRAGDPPVLYADPARIRRELRFEAQVTDLAEIVGSAWRWRKAHPQGFGGELLRKVRFP